MGNVKLGTRVLFFIDMCMGFHAHFPYVGHMKCGEWFFVCVCKIQIHSTIQIK